MELKNTEDLRDFFRNTIHEQWTNVTAVSKKAKVAQPSFQKFIKGIKGKSISTYTMFPILEVLGKKLIAVDSSHVNFVDVDIIPKNKTIEKTIDIIQNQLVKFKVLPKVTKKLLSTELRNRIEEYKSSGEPKKPFNIDLIIEFLEESYDNLETI